MGNSLLTKNLVLSLIAKYWQSYVCPSGLLKLPKNVEILYLDLRFPVPPYHYGLLAEF